MEGEGISAPAVTEPHPPSPPHQGDVGVESVTDESLLVDSQPSDVGGIKRDVETSPLSGEAIEVLHAKIVKQVEYYFSDENLPNDTFLLSHIKKDKLGFVSVGLIASFRKMKKLTMDTATIVEALKGSSLLVVSPDGKKVRRLHPLPLSDFKDHNSKLCTVLVENLPKDHSKENIKRIFGQVGSVKSICICDPHATQDLKRNRKAERPISSKLHALVEYETLEAAQKAALTLNDEKDWRNGLHVQLLQKRMAYNNNSGQKAWKGSDADKVCHNRSSPVADGHNQKTSEIHDDSHGVQDGDNTCKENDGQRSRNRRSKGHKHTGNSGMGHGIVNSCAHVEAAKPPPGPRMPDGTKGFAMGRGRPLALT